MRLKLDENLDTRLSVLLRQAGHEATTVRDQGLHGTVDPEVYDHCISGGYVFVTLDLDFSNVLRYPPEPTQATVRLKDAEQCLGCKVFPAVRSVETVQAVPAVQNV